jgi:hypothetical protein
MSPASQARGICHVTDPNDSTLNIRDAPAGKIVGRLDNERLVSLIETKRDTTGKVWGSVYARFNNKDYIGFMLASSLRCFDDFKLPGEHIALRDLRRVGLMPQAAEMDPEKLGRQLPIRCEIVPNGWGVSLSNDLMNEYRRRGFSVDAVCLALGGWGVHYDPETGKRLHLYKARGLDRLWRPTWVPDCFKSVRMVSAMMGGEIGWVPTGCSMAYHPTTGVRIIRPELVELVAGGPAGPGGDEDNRSSTISEDRLRELVRPR